MPRKTTKTTATNAQEGIDMILATVPQKSLDEAAKIVGVGQFRLLEMFSEALDLPAAMGWDSIPSEHEHLLAEFKDQQEAFESVRPVQKLPQESPTEATSLQEEENLAPSPKRGKKASTALSQTKSEAIQGNKSKTQKLATTADTLQMQNAVKRGQIKGTKKAIIELQAEQATYDAIVAASLKRETAVLASEIASFAGFDPNQLLQKAGIATPQETYTDLQETIEPQLELLANGVSEITAMDWLQDVDFFGEMGNLNKLLNSKTSEIGC